MRSDRVEEVGEAGEQRLLAPLVLRLVLQHLVAERLAEVEGLQHRVGVASVAKLKQASTHFEVSRYYSRLISCDKIIRHSH